MKTISKSVNSILTRLFLAGSVLLAVLISFDCNAGDIAPDPSVLFGKLSNGLRYVLKENHTPENRVSMHLKICAGSLNEKEGQQGLAHFLEHMLFNGSEHFPPGELVKYFQKIGMRFGPDANAYTGFDSTVYDIFLSDGSNESMKEGLIVFKDYLEGALLLPSEIEREKKIILSEKITRDSASYRTLVSTLKFEFPDALLPERLPIGKTEVIEKAERELLKNFYDMWYSPDNAIIIIVGDFDVKETEKEINNIFSDARPGTGTAEKPDFGTVEHKGIEVFYHYEKETGNSRIAIGNVKKASAKNDSSKLRREDILKKMGDTVVSYRLNEMVDSDNAPFLSADIDSGRYLNLIEYKSIEAEPKPNKWRESIGVLEKTLRAALQYGFSDYEIERVKKEFISLYEQMAKEESTMDSRDIANNIMHALDNDKVFTSCAQEFAFYKPLIESLTKEEIYEAFVENWKSDSRLIIVTGRIKPDKNGRGNYEDAIADVFYKSVKEKVSKPEKRKPILFPYMEKPKKPGRIIFRNKIEESDITRVEFENGVRLNLKKSDFEAGKIIFSAIFGYGRSSEPKEFSGLSLLASHVVNESGTGTLAKDDMEKALAGKQTDIHFGIEDGFFMYKGISAPDETELMFQFLRSLFEDPGYKESAYLRIMEYFKKRYETWNHSIEGAMNLHMERFFAGGDSRFGLPAYEYLSKLELKHIIEWLEPAIEKSEIELSVVGDFDIDKVVEYAALYLGSINKRNKEKETRKFDSPVFPEKSFKKIEIQTDVPKGLVVVAYPTDDIFDIKNTRILHMLSSIFSEKLRETVREEQGEAYSVHAFNSPSSVYDGYGVLKAMAIVEVGDEEKVAEEIEKIASDMAKGKISEDELTRAKLPTLSSIKEMLRKNTYWLDTVLINSVNVPERLKWTQTIYTGYEEISLEDVKKAAVIYLDNNKASILIITAK